MDGKIDEWMAGGMTAWNAEEAALKGGISRMQHLERLERHHFVNVLKLHWTKNE